MSQVAWIIPAAPLVAFLAIAFGARRSPVASGWLTILGVLVATVVSFVVLGEALAGVRVDQTYAWLPVPSGPAFPLGFQVDPLTATMLIVVSTVSLLVQIYSVGYMHGDAGYARYFGFMALFTMSMLGLVLANNLLAIYIFWELVGLCSYLLIGHWHERPEAAQAAKKAFIVTRLGDFGFLVGIVFLFAQTGTLQVSALANLAASGGLVDPALTVGILLVFAGAVGKSAQFPLHVWLPDAMEGPTPVSALIHAATMVAAGVYLMARTFPILEHSPTALTVVATVGAFTALFMATMGLVSTDIKRVLAYSTASQLGYMMLGIGAGAMAAGMFHLVNHAFFKALLFLCAGSIIHLVNTNDLFEMGGLRRWRPVTFVAMTVAALSLAGIPPLSGFWSKDEILGAAAGVHPVLYLAALVTGFLTAFYMFRAVFLAFAGTSRGDAHAHAEPASMTIPLLALLVPTVVSGFWGAPFLGNPFGAFLEGYGEGHGLAATFHFDVAALSTLLGVGGVLLAWAMYGGGNLHRGRAVAARVRPLYEIVANRYYVDHVYNWVAGRLVLGIAWLASQFDQTVVDGVVNGIGTVGVASGATLRRVQSGQVQLYAWVLFAGVVAIAVALVLPMLTGGRV
ncbi:MAG: NADH-quinone oxidoreductase subunit L [Chloroflexi bacterium]|nr:NADH-quinone oxidoreductase subunit L [Chloroflexota bacterium]